jgi:hypothetical protein
MFPTSFVVLGMSQHNPHQHRFVWIIDLTDKPICIALNIEDRTDASEVRMGEFASGLNKILPLRLADSVPAS